MQPGQIIEIQLVDRAGMPVRIANVLPKVYLFYQGRTEGRPRYIFEAWSTNEEGRCELSFTDLNEVRQLLGWGDLMDYNTPLTECDPVVEIHIPPDSDFHARRERILTRLSWWRPAWLTEWPANSRLAAVEPVRVTLHGRITHVDIPVTVIADE